MSQKTNPTSLRLHKNNQNFSSPLFCDFFWTENYHYNFEIENYISAFLKQTGYSKAFFSARNGYKNFSIWLFLQDYRADKKVKQLFFKYKDLSKAKALPKSTFSLGKRNTFTPKSSTGRSPTKTAVFQLLLGGSPLLTNAVQSTYRRIARVLQIEAPKGQVVLWASPKHLDLLKGESPRPRFVRGAFANKSLILEQSNSSLFKNQDLALPFGQRKMSNVGIESALCLLSLLCVAIEKEKKERALQIGDLSLRALSKPNTLQIFDRLAHNSSLRNNPILVVSFRLLTSTNRSPEGAGGFVGFAQTPGFVRRFVRRVGPKSPAPSGKDKLWALPKVFVTNLGFKAFALQSRFWTFKNQDLALPFGQRSVRSPQDYVEGKELSIRDIGLDKIAFFGTNVEIQGIRFIKDRQSVQSLLDQIVILIEKRVAWRRIKSFLFKDLSKDLQINGVRFSCSGRLGGRSKKAQKAKMQCDSFGQTSLSAFSSKLIFGSKSALTPYGKIGLKLWVCFNNIRC